MKGPIPFEGLLSHRATVYFRANLYHFPAYMSVEDLVQDAYLIYCKLAAKYPTYDESRFIATFMVSIANFAKLPKRYTQRKAVTTFTKLQGNSEVDPLDFLNKASTSCGPDEYELVKMDATPQEREALEALERNNFDLPRRKLYGRDGLECPSNALRRLSGIYIKPTRLKALLIG